MSRAPSRPKFLLDRREFNVGVGALGLLLGARGLATAAPGGKSGKKPAGIAVGYAAITWGDKSVKTAMEEIAAAGYPGIQLRRNILDEYKEPAALKAELERLKLTFACVSGGGPAGRSRQARGGGRQVHDPGQVRPGGRRAVDPGHQPEPQRRQGRAGRAEGLRRDPERDRQALHARSACRWCSTRT